MSHKATPPEHVRGYVLHADGTAFCVDRTAWIRLNEALLEACEDCGEAGDPPFDVSSRGASTLALALRVPRRDNTPEEIARARAIVRREILDLLPARRSTRGLPLRRGASRGHTSTPARKEHRTWPKHRRKTRSITW